MEEDATNTWKTILAGAMLAVGIGAVTGGLQHFPDSPERSVLIIPIGYVISVLFFASIHNFVLSKKEYLYIAISTIFMITLSIGIFFLIENTGITGHSHESIPHNKQNTHMLTGSIEQTKELIDPETVPWHHN